MREDPPPEAGQATPYRAGSLAQRELIGQRTREALAEKRAEGVILGAQPAEASPR